MEATAQRRNLNLTQNVLTPYQPLPEVSYPFRKFEKGEVAPFLLLRFWEQTCE